MTTTVSQTPGVRFIQDTEARPFIHLIYNPTSGGYDLATSSDGLLNVATYVWNTATLSWDKATQAGGGGGGGGAVTIADGADVVSGNTGDAAVITDTTGTISGKLRGLVKWAFERMPASLGQKPMATSFPIVVASDQSTIPVSIAAAVALDAGTLAALETISVANFPATQTVNDGGGSLTVDGPLTDAQLRATAVPISKAVSDLVAAAPVSASVGVASAVVLAANASRRGTTFVNVSTATISFGLDGAAAVLNSGITLTPFGSWTMDDYTFTTGAIAGIASAAASTLSIQEFT